MNSSVDSLIQYFSEILSGSDGLAYYTVFVLASGVLTGFFVCFCLVALDGLASFVVPFFKRKFKRSRSKEDV